MIKIEITDPHLMPKALLVDTAAFLMKIAGIELLPKPLMMPSATDPAVPVAAPAASSTDVVDSTMDKTEGTMDIPSGTMDIPSGTMDIKGGTMDIPPKTVANRRTAKLEKEINKLTEEVKGTRNLSEDGIVPPPPPVPRPNPLNPRPQDVFKKPAAVPPPPQPDPDYAPRPILIHAERDTNGIPWDSRIHIKSKAKNPNGTWKIRRDIDLKKVEEISQQIKITLDGAPLPPREKTKTEFKQAASGETIDRPLDWGGLMTKITGMIQDGKLTQKQVADAVKSVGVPSLPVLPTRPDLIPAVALLIDSYNS